MLSTNKTKKKIKTRKRMSVRRVTIDLQIIFLRWQDKRCDIAHGTMND